MPRQAPPRESVQFSGARRTNLPCFQDEKAFQDLMVPTKIGCVHIRSGSGGHRKRRVLRRLACPHRSNEPARPSRGYRTDREGHAPQRSVRQLTRPWAERVPGTPDTRCGTSRPTRRSTPACESAAATPASYRAHGMRLGAGRPGGGVPKRCSGWYQSGPPPVAPARSSRVRVPRDAGQSGDWPGLPPLHITPSSAQRTESRGHGTCLGHASSLRVGMDWAMTCRFFSWD
jgi:hypothetical protein